MKTSNLNENLILGGIFIFSVLFFSSGIHQHGLEFRDDEIFYVQGTREMLKEKNFLSPTFFGEERFQKPILFYWMILLSYQVFGPTWVGARMVSVFLASATVCLTWILAREFFSRPIAFLSCTILMTTPMFFRHAKNAVPDIALNFFIVLAILAAFRMLHHPHRPRYIYLFFTSCALGFLTKGFAAIFIPFFFLSGYAWMLKKTVFIRSKHFSLGMVTMILIIVPWFIFMVLDHGWSYWSHLWMEETLKRLLTPSDGAFPFPLIRTFWTNTLFYAKVLLSYFAPWSLMVLMAIPWAIVYIQKRHPLRVSLIAMLLWIIGVYGMFSLVFFKINHYMLVLTTPLAILLSAFLISEMQGSSIVEQSCRIFRNIYLIGILTLSIAGYGIVLCILLEKNPFIWGLLLIFWSLMVAIILRYVRGAAPAWSLGLFLIFVFFQSPLLQRGGLTAHAALERFAQTIKRENQGPCIIGVGSHDLHEKEFQIYFDQKLEKVATSSQDETRQQLESLFATPERVYCLITYNDYERFLKDLSLEDLRIIQEDFIFRKRLSIDVGFFSALIRLDQKKIHDYFMEKVVMVKKDPQNV